MSVSITSAATQGSTQGVTKERFSDFLEYYYSCADLIRKQQEESSENANGNSVTKQPAPQQTNVVTLTVRDWCWTTAKWVYYEIAVSKKPPRQKFGFDCYFDGRIWRQWWEGKTAKQFVLERKKYRESL